MEPLDVSFSVSQCGSVWLNRCVTGAGVGSSAVLKAVLAFRHSDIGVVVHFFVQLFLNRRRTAVAAVNACSHWRHIY